MHNYAATLATADDPFSQYPLHEHIEKMLEFPDFGPEYIGRETDEELNKLFTQQDVANFLQYHPYNKTPGPDLIPYWCHVRKLIWKSSTGIFANFLKDSSKFCFMEIFSFAFAIC